MAETKLKEVVSCKKILEKKTNGFGVAEYLDVKSPRARQGLVRSGISM